MSFRPLRLLHEPLAMAAAAMPHKTAVVVGDRRYSYAALEEASARLAGALRRCGVRRGDRVAILMGNSWPCVVAIYAALRAGAVFMVVNPQTKGDKFRFIMADSRASTVIADGDLSSVFLPAVRGCPWVRSVVCAGRKEWGEENGIAVESFETILTSPHETVDDACIPSDLAAFIYTSGSTGVPKGVMMTHQSMMFAAESILEYLRLSMNHRILCVLPLAFDYGLYQLLMAVRIGATLVLEPGFTYPAQIVNRIREQEITVFPGVPTVFSTLLAMHRSSPLSFPMVERVTNTAAALPADYHAPLREMFPAAFIFRMYGQTECKRVCYLEPERLEAKPDSVGRAIPGTEVLLLSNEGEPVPVNTPGILHVRGPHVMRGYWNNPDLTARMLKPGPVPGERMLCTTDWFRMDEEGDLYFLGRSDDIIKTRGEKVSPVEVETVLYGIPGVREAAVIGVPDELLGQAVKAFVVFQEGMIIDEREIRRFCMERLESIMVPKIIEVVAELPKTDTGKICTKDLL